MLKTFFIFLLIALKLFFEDLFTPEQFDRSKMLFTLTLNCNVLRRQIEIKCLLTKPIKWFFIIILDIVLLQHQSNFAFKFRFRTFWTTSFRCEVE